MYSDLNDKVILVTGSSSGIGEEIAYQFAAAGSKVIVTGRNLVRIRKVGEHCKKLSPKGYTPLTITADLTNENDMKKLVHEVIKTFNGLDILVNNANAILPCSIYDENFLKSFDQTMRGKPRAIAYLCHLCLPHLEKSKGNIINITSDGVRVPMTNGLPDCMVDTAVECLTRILAYQCGPKGVRVNAISPGPTLTPMLVSFHADEGVTEEILKKTGSKIPMRRAGKPEDIAYGVLFFASEKANYITGQVLCIDGGYPLYHGQAQ